VRRGDPLVVVHARSEDLIDRIASRVQNAWRIVDREVKRPPHVLARVDKDGFSGAD
jgi:thymidine phosphorylase